MTGWELVVATAVAIGEAGDQGITQMRQVIWVARERCAARGTPLLEELSRPRQFQAYKGVQYWRAIQTFYAHKDELERQDPSLFRDGLCLCLADAIEELHGSAKNDVKYGIRYRALTDGPLDVGFVMDVVRILTFEAGLCRGLNPWPGIQYFSHGEETPAAFFGWHCVGRIAGRNDQGVMLLWTPAPPPRKKR